MNERIAQFYGGEDPEKKAFEDVKLVGSNICPYCGKVFEAEAPLTPNTKRREFYGGRIKFFKDVDCDCEAKYRLCIESKFNSKEVTQELKVIDMIILEKGKTKEEREKELQEKIDKEAKDKIHELFESGEAPTQNEREKIKNEVVLANIVDLDTKIETLCYHTKLELRAMCQREKVKYAERDDKTVLAKKLLLKNPNLVSGD